MTGPLDNIAQTQRADNPPGSWGFARRLAQLALAPVERFLAIEAASGVLLFATAALALGWANSPWRASYSALWHLPLGLRFGPWSFERDLHFWINDGVMTVFFFVVGLEIRREFARGELSELRRAALPLVAAIGGMLVPAGIFAALNLGRQTGRGWGIPMATDIAFAVGVLTLLGGRVPAALRVLLLALAVIDDVGAIIVIAIFYSAGLAPIGFVIVAAGLAAILGMQLLGVRTCWAYVPPAVAAWAGAYAAGVHPALAGVAVGLMTPVTAWLGREGFIEHADASVTALRQSASEDQHVLVAHLEHVDMARREALSPVVRLERALHGWVAFGAMPLFALANAGVSLGDVSLSGDSLFAFLGVCGGLVLGKPIGVLAFCWLATRLGVVALPHAVTWTHLSILGVVAGIGFTMSIFIAGLAFPAGSQLETSKAAVLLASGLAATLGFTIGRKRTHAYR